MIFTALSASIQNRVDTLPGKHRPGYPRAFLANGGSYCYEFLPQHPDGGLFEMATAECRSPYQVLVQQRAQERLLIEAIPEAEAELTLLGFPGELGLLRNARDVEGNTYGPQENYEVNAGSAPALWLYRFILCGLIPPLIVVTLLMWAIIIAVVLIALVSMLIFTVVDGVMGVLTSTRSPMLAALQDRNIDWRYLFGWLEVGLQSLLIWPVIVPYAWAVRALLFRRIRTGLTSFLVSRPVVTGTGTLLEDGAFGLSEKAPGISTVHRYALALAGHSIYDSGNLLKGMLSPALLDLGSFKALFNRRLRLQLGLSDANRLDVAEYLKVGVTTLIIDMAEAGFIDDAPQLKRPVRALHTIVADPSLSADVELMDGTSANALQIQRWYYERARAFLKSLPTTSMEAVDLVQLWGDVLEMLADEPHSLVGQLDWVTKQYLLSESAHDLVLAARKKVDLKYHEIGGGYADRLREADLVRSLVSSEEVAFAMYQAPENSPAFARGRLIREWSGSDTVTWVSWSAARLRQEGKSRIVRLDDFRREDE